jgi:hypothetical protein
MGIEPTCEAWKASVLPLNYARLRRGESYPRRGHCQFAIVRALVVLIENEFENKNENEWRVGFFALLPGLTF